MDNIRLNEMTFAPAPVELVSFELDKKVDLVDLFWSTASEVNNEKFEIERSEDGISFRKIGEIKGIGTTSEFETYTFTDEEPTNGHNYYRLKQVDYDGQFDFSKIVSANFQHDNDDRLTVFPNPVGQLLNVSIAPSLYLNSKGTNRIIAIYDVHNRLIQSTSVSVEETDVVLDLSQLNAGVYFLSIKEGNTSMINKRILKQ